MTRVSSSRWMSAARLLLLLVLLALLVQSQQKIARLEQKMGESWANEFSISVLDGIYWVREDLEKWAQADLVTAEEFGYMRSRIERLGAILNNNVSSYKMVYPRAQVTVPKQFINEYLPEVKNDLIRMSKHERDGSGVWHPSDDDREVLLQYAEDFAALEHLIRRHFPGWDRGFEELLGSRYFGRSFITNAKMWIGFVNELDDVAAKFIYR